MKKNNDFKNDNTATWVIIIIFAAVLWAIQHSVDIADKARPEREQIIAA